MANIELDSNATGPPPSIYGAWVLRGDQADRLAQGVREGVPECSDRATLMLVEARSAHGAASAWVHVQDGIVDEHLHEHGHELLAGLGVDPEDVPYLLADVRHLDEEGRPSGRDAACRCGAGRKTKNCPHHGPPRFLSTAWLLLNREEWNRLLAHQDDFAGQAIPMMAREHARLAVRHHTLANRSLATLTTDFACGDPPFLPWTLLNETSATLSGLVVDQMPFLREAKVWQMVTRPDRTGPAS